MCVASASCLYVLPPGVGQAGWRSRRNWSQIVGVRHGFKQACKRTINALTVRPAGVHQPQQGMVVAGGTVEAAEAGAWLAYCLTLCRSAGGCEHVALGCVGVLAAVNTSSLSTSSAHHATTHAHMYCCLCLTTVPFFAYSVCLIAGIQAFVHISSSSVDVLHQAWCPNYLTE